jgi:hypothetical protein
MRQAVLLERARRKVEATRDVGDGERRLPDSVEGEGPRRRKLELTQVK